MIISFAWIGKLTPCIVIGESWLGRVTGRTCNLEIPMVWLRSSSLKQIGSGGTSWSPPYLQFAGMNPRYVETVARRGYRFIAPATELTEAANAAHSPVQNVPAPHHTDRHGTNEQSDRTAVRVRSPKVLLAWAVVGGCTVLLISSFLIWESV